MCVKTVIFNNVKRDNDYAGRKINTVWLESSDSVIKSITGHVFKVYTIYYKVEGVMTIQSSRIDAILNESEVIEAEALGLLANS